MANNCRVAVEKLHILHESSNVSNEVTISVGVSSIIPLGLMKPNELVKNADKALYLAKESGRNSVETI
jgi:diguanylate cyclase (GGDEF)-like protein